MNLEKSLKKLSLGIAIASQLSGCSLIFVKNVPPREYWKNMEYVDCTRSKGLPYLDAGIAGIAGIASLVGIVKIAQDSPYGMNGEEIVPAVSLSSNLLSGIVFGVSASRGIYHVERCKEFDDFKQRQRLKENIKN